MRWKRWARGRRVHFHKSARTLAGEHTHTLRNLCRHVGRGPVLRVSFTTSKTSAVSVNALRVRRAEPNQKAKRPLQKVFFLIEESKPCVCSRCKKKICLLAVLSPRLRARQKALPKTAETSALYFGMLFIRRPPANNLWT